MQGMVLKKTAPMQRKQKIVIRIKLGLHNLIRMQFPFWCLLPVPKFICLQVLPPWMWSDVITFYVVAVLCLLVGDWDLHNVHRHFIHRDKWKMKWKSSSVMVIRLILSVWNLVGKVKLIRVLWSGILYVIPIRLVL